MNLIPFFAFLGSGVLLTVTQRAFLSGIAADGYPLRSDQEIADEIRKRPIGVYSVVYRETWSRVRPMWTRQASPIRERQRLVALGALALTVACFVWFAVGSA